MGLIIEILFIIIFADFVFFVEKRKIGYKPHQRKMLKNEVSWAKKPSKGRFLYADFYFDSLNHSTC